MIKCPNAECGYENVDGTQFCEGCGEELPQAGGAVSSSADTITGATMIKCPACDNLNLPENVVCEVCGTELKPGSAAAAPTPTSGATASGATADTGTQSSSATPPAPPASVSIPSGNAGVAAAAPDISATTAVTAGAPTAPPDVALADLSNASGADAAQVVAAGNVTSGVTPDPGMAAASATVAAASADPTASVIAPDVSGAAAAGAPDVSVSAVPSSGAPSSGGALEPGKVKLTVEQGMSIGKQFVLGDVDILVGREDEEEQIYPDLDLSDQDEGYVHRRHAKMKFENGQLMVTHLGGVNKTRINNKPIPDDSPEAVRIGDKLSFGKVVLRVGSV